MQFHVGWLRMELNMFGENIAHRNCLTLSTTCMEDYVSMARPLFLASNHGAWVGTLGFPYKQQVQMGLFFAAPCN